MKMFAKGQFCPLFHTLLTLLELGVLFRSIRLCLVSLQNKTHKITTKL